MTKVSTAKIKQRQQTGSRARVWILKTHSQTCTSSKKVATSLWTIPPPGNQMFKDRRQFSFKPPHPFTSFCFKVLLDRSSWPQTCSYPLLSASSKLRSQSWATSPDGILFLRIKVGVAVVVMKAEAQAAGKCWAVLSEIQCSVPEMTESLRSVRSKAAERQKPNCLWNNKDSSKNYEKLLLLSFIYFTPPTLCVLIQICRDVSTCTCGYLFMLYQGRVLPVSLYLYHFMFFESWFLTEPRDYNFG